MMKRTIFSMIGLVCLALLIVPTARTGWSSTEAEKPAADGREVVEKLQSALLDAMKDGPRLGFKGRHDFLDPVIRSSFDLPLIARISVGRYWSDFTEDQKAAMVGRFSELSVATYASRFDKFSGETFEVDSENPLKEGQVLVKTRLKKSNGETVRLDYVLLLGEGQWRIINVIADGVSDISLKRGQYTSIIKRDGFDALIVKINEKIEGYANGQSD
jgi:phospholipid transport system substrate-binding protein